MFQPRSIWEMIFHHFLGVSASYTLLLLKLELSFCVVLEVIFNLVVKGPEAFVYAGSWHPCGGLWWITCRLSLGLVMMTRAVGKFVLTKARDGRLKTYMH